MPRSASSNGNDAVCLSDTVEGTISPPSYCVREMPDGKFYSDSQAVMWPARPADGYYSNNLYFKRRGQQNAQMMANIKQRTLAVSATKESSPMAASGVSDNHLEDLNGFPQAPKWFLGQMSPIKAAELAPKQKATVFYPAPEPHWADIPETMSPVLLYKDRFKKPYFFALYYHPNAAIPYWSVTFGDYQSPPFRHLDELVRYINDTGYIHPDTDIVEHLPVWKLGQE